MVSGEKLMWPNPILGVSVVMTDTICSVDHWPRKSKSLHAVPTYRIAGYFCGDKISRKQHMLVL